MANATQAAAAREGVLHLPEATAKRCTLESTETIDVAFDVVAPGLIILVAAAGDWSGDGHPLLPAPREGRVPHRLELIPPDQTIPAASEVSELGEGTLVHEVPDAPAALGRWTARLTNLATHPEDFGLFVSFPSLRELQTVDFAAEDFVDLASMAIELRRGEQASRLSVDTPAGRVVHYFTTKDMEYSCPWTPRVLVYFRDLRSTSVTLTVSHELTEPVLRYELGFDEHGLELNGTVPLHLSDMRLTIDLPLIVRYFKAAEAVERRSKELSTIAYDEEGIRVAFSFEPRFEELVEWFPGFFPRWRRLIRRTVEDACRELLASEDVRRVISNALEARVLERAGPHAEPVGVSVADGKLRVSYYEF
jgi:hypothetical protein